MNNIIKNQIGDVLQDKYLSYAISTIISRSLPDVRDGLKPVHRRIIYSMYQLKLFNNSQFKKSARIVGDVMGKFHPHGDQAIYDSLVRMAQNFSTRIPLIEGQGNFGNIDGDNAAAMRYTEARLEKIAKYFFDGIEENAVDFIDNYDGQNLEPKVLPTEIPNILINGASGIAVGMATNIPPHNLEELCKLILKLIKNPKINLSSLLKNFKGPDFPTGGETIISQKELKQIYKSGKGSLIIRSKWSKENLYKGLYQIVITEIPYQVSKNKLIEQLSNLINQKKIPLDDIWDESDEHIRIILKPKNRNIDPNKLIELCFKLSDLSIKYSCNFNVLEDGIFPKQMGIIEILKNFITHRRLIIKRKSIFKKNKINIRIEILHGLLIAYKFLDQIIKIIRKNENAKQIISKKFKLTNLQAESILNMRLGSLRKIDEVNTKNEINVLKKELNFLNKLIKNKSIMDKYISDQITKMNDEIDEKNKIRKTNLSLSENLDNQIDVTIEEFQEVEKMTVFLYKDNTIKIIKDHIPSNKLSDNQKIFSYSYLLSNQKLLIFVSSGRVYTVDPNILPSGNSNPKNFGLFVESKLNEKVINIIPYLSKKKCIIASKFGKGFIADLTNLLTNQKKGKQLFKLKLNDEVIKITNSVKKYIACVSSNQKMLIFKSSEIPTLSKSGGVLFQKFKKDIFMSDISTFFIEDGLSWNIGSQVRNEKNIDSWIGKRSQVGKKIPKRFNKDLKFADEKKQ